MEIVKGSEIKLSLALFFLRGLFSDKNCIMERFFQYILRRDK